MTTGNVSVLVEPRRNLKSLENRVSECHANLLRTLNLHFAPTGSNWLITVYESFITHIFPCVVGMIPSIIPLLKNKINLITYLHNRQ